MMNNQIEVEKERIDVSNENQEKIYQKLKWYENPVLMTPKSFRTNTTTYSSFLIRLCIGALLILTLPISLIVFIVFLVLWIFPGLGWFYERYAEARDRKTYYPPTDEIKPWGLNNEFIHVVHIRAPESKLPPIVHLNGMGITMYYAKPLFLKFVEYMGEPVEVFSFDPPGYGVSEPPKDSKNESLEAELLLLHQIISKSSLRKPFVLVGGSAGGLLAYLYYMTYPDDTAGIVLLDPTPFTAFEPESPARKLMNQARFMYRIMAHTASVGLLRPVSFLFGYLGIGDLIHFFRPSPPGYYPLLMTHTMLQKLANQFRYFDDIPDYLLKLRQDNTSHPNVPLLVIASLDPSKKRAFTGFTKDETLQWWCNNQELFLKSSSNSGFIFRTDCNHARCILDMQLVANATKAILSQIQQNIID